MEAVELEQVAAIVQHLVNWLATGSLTLTNNPTLPLALYTMAEAVVHRKDVDWTSVREAYQYTEEDVSGGTKSTAGEPAG